METLLDLARPWPLKVAVDNAIGGRPLEGPLAFLDGLGPAGLAAVAALGGIALVGIGALVGYLITYLTSATAERVGADLREAVFGELDGVDLRRLELVSLRRQIALVPQDPWMLDGTVADNRAR